MKKIILLFAAIMTASFLSLYCDEGNRFVFTQLKHNADWDPYPNAHEGLLEMLQSMTNIPLVMQRRVVELSSPDLYRTNALIIKGSSAVVFTMSEKIRLKQFIDRGGFVFIDDTLAEPRGAFATSLRRLFQELYPDRSLTKLSMDHAVFRSFFLLRQIAGRRIAEKALEGLDVGGQSGGEGRTAVLYCPNDLMGAWAKDKLGVYARTCEPGGESQRWESFKLTVNIIYFSLTGTYKRDAVHQPFIEKKLGF